jgi:hypothetical protein
MQTWYNATSAAQRIFLFVLAVLALVIGLRMTDPIGFALALPLAVLIYLQLGVARRNSTLDP